MSGVYQRNREVSEYKFFTQAIAIRVEVNKLMASSSVVPKAYRLLNAVPTVETARGIVYNVNRFEELAAMVEEEIKLLKGARKNVRVTGKKSTEERIAEAEAELERLRSL